MQDVATAQPLSAADLERIAHDLAQRAVASAGVGELPAAEAPALTVEQSAALGRYLEAHPAASSGPSSEALAWSLVGALALAVLLLVLRARRSARSPASPTAGLHA